MDLQINRLRLDVSGFARPDGERLARQVAEGLALAEPRWAASRSIDSVTTNVSPEEHAATEELSAQIVAEILRQISRSQ